MDTIGVIDTSEQSTVWSRRASTTRRCSQTIHLSGDMPRCTPASADPFFLLSIGGYHPAFQPPGGLPASVYDLDRMRAEVAICEDVWFALEAYVAITSNTLQFGAQAYLEASAKFLTVTYTARGEVSFDVLLVFSPFSFIADFDAGVAITAGAATRAPRRLPRRAPRGPEAVVRHRPCALHVLRHRRVVRVRGRRLAPAEAPPTENVLELVAEALRTPSAWRAVAPRRDARRARRGAGGRGRGLGVARLELEAVQTVAPLERELDHYGIYEIDGPRRSRSTAAGIEGAGKTPPGRRCRTGSRPRSSTT